MAFRISVPGEYLAVQLTGWDRLMNWRSEVRLELRHVRSLSIEERGTLEDGVDHRVLGFGAHDAGRRPGRRRVGTMLGRTVTGRQFWAVPASSTTTRLLVLDMTDGEFARAVLAVDESVVARVAAGISPPKRGQV